MTGQPTPARTLRRSAALTRRHSTSSTESSWRTSAPPFANRARCRSMSSSFPASCTTCSTRSAASHMRAASFGTVDDHEAIFAANRENRFGGHAYLLPSLPLLEYFARLFRLKIPDCQYVLGLKDPITGHMVCRVCLVMRAMREPMLDPGDPLLGYGGLIDADLAEFIDWEWLRSDAEPVYYLPHLATQRAEGPQSLDVLMTVVANKPRPVKPRDVTLCLTDYA